MTIKGRSRQLNPRLLMLIRIGWVALALIGLVHVYTFVSFMYQAYEAQTSILTGIGPAADGLLWYFTIITLASLIVFYGLSTLLMWARRPDWFSVLVAVALIALGTSPVDVLLPVSWIDVVGGRPAVLLLSGLLSLIAWDGLVLIVLLFPDGRVKTRWMPLLIGLAAIITAAANILFLWPESIIGQLIIIPWLILILFIPIYRYLKVFGPRQRQQAKWVIYGFMLTLAVNLIGNPVPPSLATYVELPAVVVEILRGLAGLSLTLLPITITIAIRQYRLWDIDLIIRRTLGYAAVTLLLAITYFGGVIVLQTLFSQITGSDSPLAVVASTLLIAALFNPLRTRVQAFIDGRFYRRSYDTRQTLDRFGDIARDEVVLEKIEQALVNTVNDTMQPEHIGLWLADVSASAGERNT